MDRRELSDGYAFRLSEELVSLLDAARWVSLERLCCPFLTFRLETTGRDPDYWLTLAGPPDAKAIVREALGLSPIIRSRGSGPGREYTMPCAASWQRCCSLSSATR